MLFLAPLLFNCTCTIVVYIVCSLIIVFLVSKTSELLKENLAKHHW